MLRLLTILLLSAASANAAIPIIFLRAGTNAVVIPPDPTNEVGGFTTNMFIDAEDYNFNGAFFPSAPGTNFNATSTYVGKSATEGTDFDAFDLLTSTYRPDTGVADNEHDDNHEPNGVPYTDYKIRAFSSIIGDWLQYKRIFTNDTYRIYGRVSSTVSFGMQLESIGEETATIATLNATGSGTNTFFYAPFTTNGVAVMLPLSSTNTLRVTITNGVCDFHRLMLVRWTGTPMGFANAEEDPDVIFIDENGVPFHDPEIL